MALRPSAVVVSTAPPDVSSMRNTWPATITGLSLLTDRVRLDLETDHIGVWPTPR